MMPLVLLLSALLACNSPVGEPLGYTGTVEVTEVDVAPILPGRLAQIKVDRGARVQEGDLLFVLETETAALEQDARKAGVAQAQAAIDTSTAQQRAAQVQVATLQREVKRTIRLLDKGAATDQQLSQLQGQLDAARAQASALREGIGQARAARDAAQAALAAADYKFKESSTFAPASGVVLSRNREPGEVVAAGMAVVTLGDLDRPRLRVYVPLITMEKLSLGAPATVKVDAFPDRTYTGKVEWISAEAEFTPREILTPEERVKQVFAVDIALEPAQGLNPGVPANATFPGIG